jgi:hypothetical protein
MRLTFRPLRRGRFPLKLVVYAENAEAPKILNTYLTVKN